VAILSRASADASSFQLGGVHFLLGHRFGLLIFLLTDNNREVKALIGKSVERYKQGASADHQARALLPFGYGFEAFGQVKLFK
jgi:hypothetical protein